MRMYLPVASAAALFHACVRHSSAQHVEHDARLVVERGGPGLAVVGDLDEHRDADALADAVVGGGDARQEVDFAVGVLGGEDHALAVFGRPRRVRGLVVAEVPEGHEPVSQRDRAHEENIGAREAHAAALCGEQRGVRCAGRRGFSA